MELIRFWNEAPLDKYPFAHPKDLDAIDNKHVHPAINSYQEYVDSLSNGSLVQKKLHLSLLPQPYFGDLKNARFIVLLLNPGLHSADYFLENEFPQFRQEMLQIIRQTCPKNIFLDPRYCWTSGFDWWEKKLRGVATIIANEKFSGNYGEALQLLSKEVASIELVPYHSTSFSGRTDWPCSVAARKAVQEIAKQKHRKIIATRRVRDWDLPTGDNVIKYGKRWNRSASLSPESPGGKEILKGLLESI